jgi:anti-anti-sigma factor
MTPITSLSVTISRRRLRRFPRRAPVRTVVRLRGEHDLSTVDALSESLAAAIALDDVDVVVDMSEVQFMGAATVGVLIRARELLRMRSRSLVVRSPSWCARRVLESCGDTELLDGVEATPLSAPALGTWVAVPTIDPVGHGPDTSLSEPAGARDPIRAGHVTAARVPSVDVEDLADEHAADVAGLGAP